MMDYLRKLFSSDGFMPHGHCYLWQPGVLWLHIVSDALVALAYFSIPFTLLYFVRKRRDIEFNWMFVCFAVFIVACGITHLMEIWVIWHPTYWLSGGLKAVTAFASVPTAVLLVKLVPDALRFPSPSALQKINAALANEIADRKRAEGLTWQLNQELEQRVRERTLQLEDTVRALETEIAERRRAENALRESQQLLQAISDNSPAVIYAKDLEGRYLLVNRVYTELFHLRADEIVGKTDREIFPLEAADAFRAMDLRVAASDRALTEEEVAPHDDGPHTYISVKCPLRDAQGKLCGIFGISTDITSHKQAEEAKAQLAAIVESSGDAIISKKLDGTITSWNAGAEKLFGYSAREATGKSILMLFPLERLGEEADIVAAISRGTSIAHFETVRRRKDGSPVDVSVTFSPIKDTQGRIIGISKIARDITERKRAYAKLQDQLSRLNLLNQITRAIGERQDLASIFQAVIRSLEDQLPVDFSCICLHDPMAEVLTVKSVGVRSQPLAMEVALTVQARVPIDQNGLSRCVQGHLVYEPDIGQVPFPFPQRLWRGGLRALVIAPLLVESRVFGVLVAARREAESFDSADCEFLRQLTEHVALAAHQAQIYSALQEAYNDLRQSQQAVMEQERLRVLGQMASGIAHDINNAISPVGLYTESLLDNEPNLSARARSYLGIIQHAIEDVAQTVARMREFYRRREPQLALAPVDLNKLLQQVIDLSRARWNDIPQQRGVVIHMVAEPMAGLPAIMGIESEIREALVNIIFNAVDAMPEGGTLTLRTGTLGGRSALGGDKPASQIYIESIDTGAGMDEETRRRCLEPFFTTKGERGTGLGLPMVYGIVRRHNGEIEIDSKTGQGTKVRLTFPLMPETESGAAPSEMARTVAGPLRILVIDDDPLLLKSLRDILETEGHWVTAANGGQAGIDAFRAAQERNEAFSAVITDLGMPYVDGRKVARVLKEMSPAIPVLLLTGWGQRLVSEGEVPPYIDRVLNKPPKLRDLREALAACLRASSPE